MFSIPALGCQGENFDDLLLGLDSLGTRSEASFTSKDINELEDATIAPNQRFIEWEDSRVKIFKPITIGNVSQSHRDPGIAVGYWPGKVETYFDLYVAGVWNIFRTARLLLIAL